MPLLDLLILLVIAGIVGTLAEFVIGFAPGGLVGSVIIGVLGTLIGQWLSSRLHLPRLLLVQIGTRPIDILWATLGSLLLVSILSVIRGRRLKAR